MILNRRGLFGAGVGAAVAGPDMARAVVNEAAASSIYAEKIMASKMYDAEQLARIRRIASGDIQDDDDRNYPTHGPAPDYGALKSVSNEARHFLLSRRCEERSRRNLIDNAIKALEWYDKTGVVRNLF